MRDHDEPTAGGDAGEDDHAGIHDDPARESVGEDGEPDSDFEGDDEYDDVADDVDHDHHHHHDVEQLGVAVMTISSSRNIGDDPAGDCIVEEFEERGHEVVNRELIRDDFDGVQGNVNNQIRRSDVDVVVTCGGTGVTPDDVTIEAIDPLLDKRLPGFGELFRRLSYDEVGTTVVATRATAGVANGTLLFCLPGSENAARLGTREIIVPESSHLAGLAQRGLEDEEA